MALDTGEFLDPSRKGSVARYINHSCNPNCTMEIWTIKGELRAVVYTLKHIPKGTEFW